MCGIWVIFGSDRNARTHFDAARKVTHRGPDAFRFETIHNIPGCFLGFHRLAIVDDLSGMQPMRLYRYPHVWLLCNGEIYNHKSLSEDFGVQRDTACDGEVIIHLYVKGGIEFATKHLDGVFAFCLLDTANRKCYLGRDTFGVRPLFRIKNGHGFLAACSEVKGLMDIKPENGSGVIEPFPPGQVETYDLQHDGKAKFIENKIFHTIGEVPSHSKMFNTLVTETQNVKDGHVEKNLGLMLESAVSKRLMSDRRIGCLLSGGLDSSLVAALVAKKARENGMTYPIQTFSIGFENSPDLLAANKVAGYIGSEHHEIIITEEEAISAINEVIYHLECYDPITIRSSVPMYLLGKYIKEKTDTTVVLSGEGADEVMQGYLYFHKAPSTEAADIESRRLCKDLFMYDVLRGDRTIAAWGLEIRLPFLDHQLTSYFFSLSPSDRQPREGIEKYLLRSAFSNTDLLPQDIVWRPKEGFSDGITPVDRSWYQILQEHMDGKISESEFQCAQRIYTSNIPKTKESLYYRKIFEEFYPNMESLTPYFWTLKWSSSTDPSSRTLDCYKTSDLRVIK